MLLQLLFDHSGGISHSLHKGCALQVAQVFEKLATGVSAGQKGNMSEVVMCVHACSRCSWSWWIVQHSAASNSGTNSNGKTGCSVAMVLVWQNCCLTACLRQRLWPVCSLWKQLTWYLLKEHSLWPCDKYLFCTFSTSFLTRPFETKKIQKLNNNNMDFCKAVLHSGRMSTPHFTSTVTNTQMLTTPNSCSK